MLRRLVIVVALAVSGCAGLAQNDDDYCQSIGNYPTTNGYAECRASRAQGRQQNAAAGMMFLQQQQQRQLEQQQNLSRLYAPPRPVNTTCTNMGSIISCQTN